MPEENGRLKYLDATGAYTVPDSDLLPLEIPAGTDLNDYYTTEYLDKYYYCSECDEILHLPVKKSVDMKNQMIPINEFYLKTYTIIPDMVCGQMLVENNNIWVRTGMEGNFSDWELIYATNNYEPPMTGDGGNGELDDLIIKTGKFKNKGSGWQTFIFPWVFDTIPQVFCKASEFHVDVKEITTTEFKYRVYSYSSSSKTDTSDTDLEISWLAIEYGGD